MTCCQILSSLVTWSLVMKIGKVMLIAAGAIVSVAAVGTASTHFGSAHSSGRPTITGENSADARVSRRHFLAEQLRPGMSKVEVERIMGRPAASETVAGTTIEVWTYPAETEEPLSTRL